jgi:hypothetical protein
MTAQIQVPDAGFPSPSPGDPSEGDGMTGGGGTCTGHPTSACRCRVSLCCTKNIYIVESGNIPALKLIFQQPSGKYCGNHAEGLGVKFCLHQVIQRAPGPRSMSQQLRIEVPV